MALETYTHTSDSYFPEPNLPPDVLAVLPSDSLLQLELAYKITCHAYALQVSRLEGEAQQMQTTLGQNQQQMKALERRVTSMEAEMLEHQQRARQSIAEQHKLAAEKNALIETVKRLNRELAKLEHFKKNLLQQLQDEEQSDAAGSFAPSLAAIDLTTERLVSEVLQSADGIAAAAAAATGGLSGQSSYTQQMQQSESRQQHSGLHAGGSRLSPPQAGALGAAGGINRMLGSPRGSKLYTSTGPSANSTKSGPAAAAGGSPYSRGGGAGVRSPPTAGPAAAGQLCTGNRFASPPAGRTADHLNAAAAGRAAAGSAAGSVPMSSPRIDGKEFFRQARGRLSYEQFSQFLVAIKDLNAGRATREETLAAARQLFGTANSDLYGLFEGLLVRHLTAL